ncbi:UNVERIFIED_CONTAM: putative mitochondrial protein [Sesamum latifolium]|uniref:Mitochondrial protein n=1 Tax=Sesamum latifolium TaxID=2727402 RepID=A0AAW2YA51_9LAMI
MVCDVNNVNSLNMHEWLIDPGCTFHMSPFRKIFTNFESGNSGFVSMANEKRCEIKGLGDICLMFKDGYKLTLKNVRYVPDLSHNLISCAALEEEGLEGRWGKGVMKIMKGSLTVFKAERKQNLYVCSVDYDILAASVMDDDKTSLWHKRLGHISEKGLELLKKDGVLIDKIDKLKFCDDCVLGKQHKVHFPVFPYPNPSSSSSILDYVHADVWGPSNTPTQGDKLEPRSQKCVFIGYPQGVKGYRLWLRSQSGFKVIIIKDVVFNETEMPCLNNQKEKKSDIENTFNKVESFIEDNQ